MQIKSKTAFLLLFCSLFLMFFLEIGSQIFKKHFYINLTSSLPAGLYQTVKTNQIKKGDLVLFAIPSELKSFALKRSWLKHKQLLMKPVIALANDTFCVQNQKIFVNQHYIGLRKSFDSFGESLPKLQGCHQLLDDEFLPMSLYSQNSFDGRYFGALSKSLIVGVVKPVFVFS